MKNYNKIKMNLISSSISLIVTSLLLIFVVFSWYVTNDKATVTGVNGASQDNDSGHFIEFTNNGESISILPDEISLLEYKIIGTSENGTITFTSKANNKEVKKNSDNLINTIVTERSYIDEDETHQNIKFDTDITKLALVDEYYGSNNSSNKLILNEKEKLEAFSNLYNGEYSILNHVKVCILDEEEPNLKSLIVDAKKTTPTNEWYSLSSQFSTNLELELNDDEEYEKTIYMYFYFDPTDIYVKTKYHKYILDNSGFNSSKTYYDINGDVANVDDSTYKANKYYVKDSSETEIYFYGQNQYFYQFIIMEMLVI